MLVCIHLESVRPYLVVKLRISLSGPKECIFFDLMGSISLNPLLLNASWEICDDR
jgi:hypothetical protein